MKIGIITQPLRTNYGGLLQAYALQTVLERAGHDVKILDEPFKKRLPLWKFPFSIIKRSILKFVFKRDVTVFDEFKYNQAYPVVSQYTTPFIQKYIHRIEVKCFARLKSEDFDALIVGSDQVWRPIYNSDIYRSFLNFAEKWKVKRIAYAASFGTDEWEFTLKQTKRCAQLAKKFNLVTTREDSGVELCKKYLGISAYHVLDPTLLLERDGYDKLVSNAIIQECSGKLMTYILDESPEMQSIIEQVALKKSLKPFSAISRVENKRAPLKERIQPLVEQWLYSFQNADFVITDSFHACVFSIIYNVPFAVLGNAQRGQARFFSLLKMFGLENRCVSTAAEIIGLPSITWNCINTRIEELKYMSLNILLKELQCGSK